MTGGAVSKNTVKNPDPERGGNMRTLLKLATSVYCTVAMLAVTSAATAADKAMKSDERLQMQEQRIEALEKRLKEVETAAMSGTAPGPSSAPESTADTQAKPESRDTVQLISGSDLASQDFPGSWPMFVTDMRMKIGGYIKSDFVFDLDGTTDPYQFLMSTIPVEGTPEHENDGYVSFFSKETRFNIDVRRITPGTPPLRAFVEGDFFSSGNQFRLRHAYMTVGDFLIGQTWTTLSFLESLPFTIDFAAGDALFGGRTTQIRYQKTVNDEWKLAVALEGLDSLGIENPYGLGGQAIAQLPLLALRADYKWETGVLSLGSSIAQLHWDGGATGPTDSALQYDTVVGGRQYLGTDNYVTWNVSYGKGSGENIMAFSGSNANGVLDLNGKLDTFYATSAVAGYWHRWSDKWSSNFTLAYGWLDTPDTRSALALKAGGIQHLNLILQPVKQFSSGVEYMWGKRRAQNDALGSARRIQFMAKYEF